MKKVCSVLAVALAVLAFAACSNEAPKSDLNEQEQASVDSLMNSDQAQMDSLEKKMKAEIGQDSAANAEEGHHHDHDHDH